jgi:hypothetical protein
MRRIDLFDSRLYPRANKLRDVNGLHVQLKRLVALRHELASYERVYIVPCVVVAAPAPSVPKVVQAPADMRRNSPSRLRHAETCDRAAPASSQAKRSYSLAFRTLAFRTLAFPRTTRDNGFNSCPPSLDRQRTPACFRWLRLQLLSCRRRQAAKPVRKVGPRSPARAGVAVAISVGAAGSVWIGSTAGHAQLARAGCGE